jgi:hypothetical protein
MESRPAQAGSIAGTGRSPSEMILTSKCRFAILEALNWLSIAASGCRERRPQVNKQQVNDPGRNEAHPFSTTKDDACGEN